MSAGRATSTQRKRIVEYAAVDRDNRVEGRQMAGPRGQDRRR